MNDNTKVLDHNPVSGIGFQPQAPVGVANKEVGPIPPVIPEIRRAGPEVSHEINQELRELRVEEKKDVPDLTQVVDMKHAGPSVPIPPGPTGLVQIPETKDIGSSGTWLNALIGKIQKVMQFMGV